MSAVTGAIVRTGTWVSGSEAIRRSAGTLTRWKLYTHVARGEIRTEFEPGCAPRYRLEDVVRVAEAIRASQSPAQA